MSGFWITKSDGLLTEVGEKRYTNKRFVDTIRKDPSPMGKLMLSRFPTPTEISISGDIPQHWIHWEDRDIDTHRVDSIVSQHVITEIPAENRLYVGRGEISSRTRSVLSYAGISVTPRGVRDDGNHLDQEETLASIVFSLYHLVEKHSLSSMKSKNSTLSTLKTWRFTAVRDIVASRRNVLDVALLSSYVEPSPIVASNSYYLGTVYGMSITHALINDVYYRHFQNQVSSVVEAFKQIP